MGKIYIVRKFVVAKSVKEAIKKEKKVEPIEVYLEDTSIRQYCEDIIKK